MEANFIKFNTQDGVAIISLNRSDVLNSFNLQMAKELQHALDLCAADSSIRCVVLTGEGRAFCAGQDLAEAIAEDAPDIAQIVEAQYNPIIRRIREIEKPVIGCINGVAAGAGVNIAISCDITFAAESASFIQSFSNISLIPDSGGTFFLPRLIGMQRATALMFLANKIKAAEAKSMGMIYEVLPDEQLKESVLNFAKEMAQKPTKGLGLTKRALNLSLFNNLEDQLEVEKQLQAEAGKTYDNKEGINAFLEKRKPIFKGE
ncbi:MAG: enoyl-CoA hydratase-related protein [Flavobacteriales bacterium]